MLCSFNFTLHYLFLHCCIYHGNDFYLLILFMTVLICEYSLQTLNFEYNKCAYIFSLYTECIVGYP